MEQLKLYHLETYSAVEWFRKNKDHHSVAGEVLEPAFLHIELDPEFHSEVESLLGFQALSFFLIADPSDFSKFTRLLADASITVNAAELVRVSPSDTLPSSLPAQFGFASTASNFIRARPEYLRFFNSYGHFHLIPISKTDVDEHAFYKLAPQCRRIVVAGRYSEIRRSKYGSDFALVTSSIPNRGL